MRSFLPGRPQSTRQALCTVNWDGLRLIAYISGSTIIIFNGRREVLQSISVDEAISLCSLSIDEQSGRLAASDGKAVYLYQPLGRDYGDLRWARSHTLASDASWAIRCLSWGSPDDILVSGQQLILWNLADEDKPEAIWSSDLSSPVETALFSPDGGLIASCGLYDRMVKIWRRLSYEQDSTRFDVAYLPHPNTITSLSWRQFWHQEQNMDNLLYTCCADGNVRVWAHTDHHALCVLQKIITLDTNASIQPRRMSLNSISKNRFTVVLQSRDLARATERAVQTARSGTDHALEHLVEVANRSPEICVILDGLGHMSAWGIENIASKSKALPEKFNVALVDGINIALPKETNNHDSIQMIAFANNDAAASLCILVHSFAGQIDWYQGSFVSFFDTGSQQDRLDLQVCWSGHESAVDKMISSPNHQNFLSLTEADQVICWSQAETASPLRICEMTLDSPIVDATFLDDAGYVAILQESKITVWKFDKLTTKLFAQCDLAFRNPLAVSCSRMGISNDELYVTILFENACLEVFKVRTTGQAKQPKANGYHVPIVSSHTAVLPFSKKMSSFCFGKLSATPSANTAAQNLLAWSDSGDLETCSLIPDRDQRSKRLTYDTKTYSASSNIAALFGESLSVVVHADYRTVTIWNLAQQSFEWSCRFTDYDLVEDVYWFSASNVPILAIRFAYYVVAITPYCYDNGSGTSSWRIHQVIQARPYTSHVIGAVCWLDPNQIAVGVGNQILTFELSGIASFRDSLNTNLVEQAEIKAAKSFQLQNSSYSLYHPYCLGTIFAGSDTHTGLHILSQLYEDLKFLTPGEEVQFDESGIFRDRKFEQANLSEIGPNLKDYISRISESQLVSQQKQNLRELVDIADELTQSQNSMDHFALSYLYHFLQALSRLEHNNSELEPLPYPVIISASLSRTQEALLHYVLAVLENRKVKLTWSTARALGIFLFIEDEASLRVHFESVARAEYNRNPDDKSPVDCSLYYLALDKKAVLQSLWRRTLGLKEKEATMKLLAHDFKDGKWKATALKNAYALLSRRRFEYAAAFFLLGGSLSDAVNVCTNQLHDLQLAVALTRVWTGDPADRSKVMDNITNKVVPTLAIGTHDARWMLLWSRIQHKDWSGVMHCIVKPVHHLLVKQFQVVYADNNEDRGSLPRAMSFTSNDPTLLINVYTYCRQLLHDSGSWSAEMVREVNESRFVLRSAQWYQRAGLDWLALKLVSEWKFLEVQRTSTSKSTSNGNIAASIPEAQSKSMLDDWMVPATTIPVHRSANIEAERKEEKSKSKPPPTQFVEPSADSLLDSFGF